MSHATLAHLTRKALREAGYTPAEIEMQIPGYTIDAGRDGSVIISHSPTYDLQHTQAYEIILKERTPFRVNLIPITGALYQLSVREPLAES